MLYTMMRKDIHATRLLIIMLRVSAITPALMPRSGIQVYWLCTSSPASAIGMSVDASIALASENAAGAVSLTLLPILPNNGLNIAPIIGSTHTSHMLSARVSNSGLWMNLSALSSTAPAASAIMLMSMLRSAIISPFSPHPPYPC
ncbi:hypothetical protein HRbin04_01149 [archaeon HR04]|nr:hypothetical protein HRbin04_01149 [archaeon HR04]